MATLRQQSGFAATARVPQYAAPDRIDPMRSNLGVQSPPCPSSLIYATFDGLFQRALLRHMAGELNAVTETQANIMTFLIRSQPCVFILSARWPALSRHSGACALHRYYGRAKE